MSQANDMIFCFGSNEAGTHGAGAARHAYLEHGAVMGRGFGHEGNSYAIPTKDKKIRTLPIQTIEMYVDGFIKYAALHHYFQFKVTRIGCGLAGYKDAEIAPLFKSAPENCSFDSAWEPWLGDSRKYWGTM